jgi:molybdopterin synthase sulfur carrier subunit
VRESCGGELKVSVRIPAPLRRFAGDAGVVPLEATDVGDAVRQLEGVRERVLDERGELRRHVNVFVNGESVKFLDGLATPLKDGEEVAIIPAVSGGAAA